MQTEGFVGDDGIKPWRTRADKIVSVVGTTTLASRTAAEICKLQDAGRVNKNTYCRHQRHRYDTILSLVSPLHLMTRPWIFAYSSPYKTE